MWKNTSKKSEKNEKRDMSKMKWKLTLAIFIPGDHWLTTLLSRLPWQPCEIIKRKRIGVKECLQRSGYTPCYSWTQTFLVQGIFNLFFFFSLLQQIFLEQTDSLFWQEMGSLRFQLTAMFQVSFFLSKGKSSRADIYVLLQRTHNLWGNESYAK